MVKNNYAAMGLALNDGFLSVPHPDDAERFYEESLERKPDVLVFHGTPGLHDASDRFDYVEKDLENLSDRHDLSGTVFHFFRDEHVMLEDRIDDVEEKYGLDIEVSDFGPYPAWQDWIPVRESTERGDSIRSYTSRSNRRKLQRTGEQMLEGRDLEVFGVECESDSLARKVLGELDYHLRQKRGVEQYLG